MNTTEKKAAQKSKQHTAYYNKAGKRVPGCTTITGVMDKPALVSWANRIGLEGIEVGKYVDELASIGTLAHYLIECRLTGAVADLGDYTKNQIEAAQIPYQKFLNWAKAKNLRREDFAISEGKLVSEKHQFGGTIDLCAVIDGKATLIDIKTAKGIFGEHKTQVFGGYHLLCEENKYGVEKVLILRIGRDETEGFEQVEASDEEIELHRKRFLCCRELYELNRQINKRD
jgi:hypothetical protein